MGNTYYCYTYLDPRKPGKYSYKNISFLFEPLYIGKGKNKRYLEHLKYLEKHTNYDFKHVLKEILNEGFTKQDIENHILIIYCNSEQEAFDLEIRLIKEIGRSKFGGSLVNWTDGGEGVSGYIPSKEKNRKHSIRMRAKNNPMYGMKRLDISGDNSPMKKQEVKERFIGENNPSKRLDVRQKISEGKSKLWKITNSKNNEIQIVKNIRKFCNETKIINYSTACDAIRKKKSTRSGYLIEEIKQ